MNTLLNPLEPAGRTLVLDEVSQEFGEENRSYIRQQNSVDNFLSLTMKIFWEAGIIQVKGGQSKRTSMTRKNLRSSKP
jgi:hypothetical protein